MAGVFFFFAATFLLIIIAASSLEMINKYCSNCEESKNVSSGDNYCPTCGTAFGTDAKLSSSSSSSAIAKSVRNLVDHADKKGGSVEAEYIKVTYSPSKKIRKGLKSYKTFN
jgi:hypothetical protein